MTKDTAKQPDMPEKKPKKKAARKAVPKKKQEAIEGQIVEPIKYDLDLDAEKYKKGLTLGQWQELSKQDRSTLTPAQLKQLEDANKAGMAAFEKISQQYDFTAIFKAAQPLPIQQIAEQARSAVLAMSKINSALILPSQQLAQLQQNLIQTNSVISQALLSTVSAANIARSVFAGFEDLNVRILKAFQVDIPSLGIGISHISATEIINLDKPKLSKQDGHIVVNSDTSQVRSVEGFELVSNGHMEMLFTRLDATDAQLESIRKLIETGSKDGVTKIEPANVKLIREDSVLRFADFKVPVRGSSRQARFCEFFIETAENFFKKWDVAEFVENAFGLHVGIDGSDDDFKSLVKGYVKALNTKIAASTNGQFVDFFMLVNYDVYINPKYLT